MTSRVLALCIAVFALGGSSPAGARFAGGDGTPANPHQIASAEQLVAVGADPNLWDKHFVLIHDLDMAVVDPNAMQPIGDSGANPFRGTFDGKEHVIANLRIAPEEGFWIGLFRKIGENRVTSQPTMVAQVRNLHLRNVNIRGQNVVGGLAGELGSGTITNCSVTGVVAGEETVGGLVGWAFAQITSCTTAVEVRGTESVGGLVGDIDGILLSCSSSGSVRGRARIGGLVGSNGFAAFFGSIREENKPDVSEYAARRIATCHSDCTVVGEEDVGGLIGHTCGAGTVQDCYALGPVEGTARVGGLLGTTVGCGTIRCFSAGRVRGKEDTGGLIGKNEPLEGVKKLVKYPPCRFVVEELTGPSLSENGRKWLLVYRPAIVSCFWDAEASGMTRGLGAGTDAQGGITRLTTGEMRTSTPFRNLGWDFEDIWTISPDEPYPGLRWEQVCRRD